MKQLLGALQNHLGRQHLVDQELPHKLHVAQHLCSVSVPGLFPVLSGESLNALRRLEVLLEGVLTLIQQDPLETHSLTLLADVPLGEPIVKSPAELRVHLDEVVLGGGLLEHLPHQGLDMLLLLDPRLQKLYVQCVELLDRQLVQDGLDGAHHRLLVARLLVAGLARLLLRGPGVLGGLQLLRRGLAHRPPLHSLVPRVAVRGRRGVVAALVDLGLGLFLHDGRQQVGDLRGGHGDELGVLEVGGTGRRGAVPEQHLEDGHDLGALVQKLRLRLAAAGRAHPVEVLGLGRRGGGGRGSRRGLLGAQGLVRLGGLPPGGEPLGHQRGPHAWTARSGRLVSRLRGRGHLRGGEPSLRPGRGLAPRRHAALEELDNRVLQGGRLLAAVAVNRTPKSRRDVAGVHGRGLRERLRGDPAHGPRLRRHLRLELLQLRLRLGLLHHLLLRVRAVRVPVQVDQAHCSGGFVTVTASGSLVAIRANLLERRLLLLEVRLVIGAVLVQVDGAVLHVLRGVGSCRLPAARDERRGVHGELRGGSGRCH
mmetsp:Transcript_29251/g.86830  ORF Transcript_29251/g.86830 Transcript_29251/m.86830 type:complete len:537 (-) Transcript_29251:104-1714(-)